MFKKKKPKKDKLKKDWTSSGELWTTEEDNDLPEDGETQVPPPPGRDADLCVDFIHIRPVGGGSCWGTVVMGTVVMNYSTSGLFFFCVGLSGPITDV